MIAVSSELPEDEALAAEYVLGVLDLAERTAAEARMRVDSPFSAKVAAWERDLSALNDAYAEVEPPVGLLARIEARLFPNAEPMRRLSFWRFFGGVATAVVLGVAVLIAVPRLDPSGPSLTASLTAEAQPLVFDAAYADGTLRVARAAGSAAEAGSVYHLWLIAGEAAPVSLGLIEGRSVEVLLPALTPGTILAVSLEPAGGSTTGAPTGPVLVTGALGA